MATIRLFAAAREAAATGRDHIAAPTVGAVLDEAERRYGEAFTDVLATAQVWRNGEPARRDDPVGDDDEVAVLPPVSGGSEALDPAVARTAGGSGPGAPPGAIGPIRPARRTARRRRPG